jgi:hypothetical protein
MKSAKIMAVVSAIPSIPPEDRPGWYQSPNAMYDALGEIPGSTLKVYNVLLFHADRNKIAWPKVETIAKVTRLSMRQVHRSLRWLEKHEWIKGTRRRREPTRYRLWFPPNPIPKNDACVIHDIPVSDTGVTQNLTAEEGPAPWDDEVTL